MNCDNVHLSVIIPTKGRPELYATLLSVYRGGFLRGDEVLVVGDGEQPEARKIVSCFTDRLPITYRETAPIRALGGVQRNLAIGQAKGTHLVFIDDDDIYVEGGLEVVRKTVAKHYERISVFRMRGTAKRLHYDVLWREPVFLRGNIGTPMFAVPNVKEKLGTWGLSHCGDFAFLESTLMKYPEGKDALVWNEAVIVEVR